MRILILSLLLPLLIGCSNASGSDQGSTPPAVQANSSPDPVHQIVLPHDEPDFPPGPGRDLFISRCMVCHSLRYITMQPDFPGKTWGKEVDKMVKTYGAHVTKDEASQITAYLTAIKGSDRGADKSTSKGETEKQKKP